MQRIAFIAVLALGRVAAAQSNVVPFVFTGGDFTITFLQPSGSAGRIDCNPLDEDKPCRPLNLAECSNPDDARILQFDVSPNGKRVAVNSQLHIWIEQEDTQDKRCNRFDSRATNNTSQQALTSATTLGPTHPLVLGSGDFKYPEDEATKQIRVHDLVFGDGSLNLLATIVPNACAEGAKVDVVYRICFGVEQPTGLAALDGVVEQTDLQGWARIPVDTIPPAAVSSVEVEALDARIELTPTLATSESSTLAIPAGSQWEVFSRTAADVTATVPAIDCENLPSEGLTRSEFSATEESSPIIDAENGVATEGCIGLVDPVGNEGGRASFIGTALNQCDFVECYPDKLEGGYCGAASGEGFTLVLSLLALAGLRRRRGK